KMFVGGLNWDTTDETLRQYFSEFGKVDACTIMRDASGRSRGFAFLTFEDPAAVNAVMVREHYLDGKIIDPKRAIPRQEHNRTQKVFVGGLAPSVTNESMRHFFSQFGKVIDATVMIDRDSSRSKGFGFVTFDEKADVDQLIGMGGLDIEGKVVSTLSLWTEVNLKCPIRSKLSLLNHEGHRLGVGKAVSTARAPKVAVEVVSCKVVEPPPPPPAVTLNKLLRLRLVRLPLILKLSPNFINGCSNNLVAVVDSMVV
ncbi:hypothetical protein BU17DRAFT_41224, partial [Hysterangium stoloniferum]